LEGLIPPIHVVAKVLRPVASEPHYNFAVKTTMIRSLSYIWLHKFFPLVPLSKLSCGAGPSFWTSQGEPQQLYYGPWCLDYFSFFFLTNIPAPVGLPTFCRTHPTGLPPSPQIWETAPPRFFLTFPRKSGDGLPSAWGSVETGVPNCLAAG